MIRAQGIYFLVCLLFTVYSCKTESTSDPLDKKRIEAEVRTMFDQYHAAIIKDGLTGEFPYLDQSDEFFWVPPGYTKALNYESIHAILSMNAPALEHAEFHWKDLDVFPLSNTIATFTGIVEGHTIDTAGTRTNISLIESGAVIKREDGWKLLCGQTSGLPSKER